jgi:hypothetical protein
MKPSYRSSSKNATTESRLFLPSTYPKSRKPAGSARLASGAEYLVAGGVENNLQVHRFRLALLRGFRPASGSLRASSGPRDILH